ncbi:hypothetical protein ACVNS2_18675 [Paenibacillus caseinilyticus]|uniref:Uncharacterized protein n=1 Tax=Paenibacillus mucilaginosus K02 TaxID=997761 RepID=I0BJX8_9BACL|nr:hypothetical protein [Paenibacillus mucilaginosus]AFH62675.1 hypothetical protein B2K_18435 [Paenibacillus mucilaginosus K02]
MKISDQGKKGWQERYKRGTANSKKRIIDNKDHFTNELEAEPTEQEIQPQKNKPHNLREWLLRHFNKPDI